MPAITVVMPAYNSQEHIREAIDSICAQTFTDWELLVINEYGSDDGTASIVKELERKDARIHLHQNQKRLGLARSLNEGILLAKGEYIARMDADDISASNRLQKQWEYMETHEDVIVLGTAQHHFGPHTDWIHRSATDAEQLKANLLFFCDICHSTVMMRKKALVNNNLFYNPDCFAEDYELWTRVVNYGKIANLPDVLGEYRWGAGNITASKRQQLAKESGILIGRNLTEHLQIDLSEHEMELMNSWQNPCLNIFHRSKNLNTIKKILQHVFETNQRMHYVDDNYLLQAIGAKWRWDKYCEPITNGKPEKDLWSVFSYNGYAGLVKRVIAVLMRKVHQIKNEYEEKKIC